MWVNAIKTLPRDLRIISAHVKSLIKLKKVEKRGGSVGKLFDECVLRHPDKPAILFNDEIWTFRKVQETSNKIGNFFAQAGFKQKDVVCLLMENRPEYVCTWLGLAKIGVVTALINFNLRSSPLQHSIAVANSKAIVCGSELGEALSEVYPNLKNQIPIFESSSETRTTLPNAIDLVKEYNKMSLECPEHQESTKFLDDLFYLYTSGTTGLPKAAVIKHSRFLMAGTSTQNAGVVTKDDIIYGMLPLYHTSTGILGTSQTLIGGNTLALRDKFSASSFWSDCIKYKVTAAQYMGETMRYLLRQPHSDLDRQHGVKCMFGNGLREEIWTEFVTRFGIERIFEVYGATEGNVSTANGENKPGACGFIPLNFLKALFPYFIIKLDENENPVRDPKTGLCVECKPGEIGELVGLIRKNHPFGDFRGYAADKSASEKKTLRDVRKKGDAVFRTGDIFMKDELGFIYFKDRMGDTYRWKGENVSTTEIEYIISNATMQRLDTIVFPVKIPHTEGKAGMAVVANDEGNGVLDVVALGEKLKKTLPSYAIPLFLRISKHIEMTGTQKMKKTEFVKDGFDIEKIAEDKIFFWLDNQYVPLTKDLYEKIISGNIRL